MGLTLIKALIPIITFFAVIAIFIIKIYPIKKGDSSRRIFWVILTALCAGMMGALLTSDILTALFVMALYGCLQWAVKKIKDAS